MSASPIEKAPVRLPRDQFLKLVELGPLVSIDLVIRDDRRRMLLGAREKPPAHGYWFVPGGRVGKNERVQTAFDRICEGELGRTLPASSARFLGVYKHLYEENFAGAPGFGTHCIVLAYAINCVPEDFYLPHDQHSAYDWLYDAEILACPDVHPYCRAYCGK